LGWETIPIEVVEKTCKFVAKYGKWAISNIIEDDLLYGKNIMNKIVQLIINEDQVCDSYLKGTRASRDTLLLFVEFILAFLQGKFYTGR
jgi:hypothetical protein